MKKAIKLNISYDPIMFKIDIIIIYRKKRLEGKILKIDHSCLSAVELRIKFAFFFMFSKFSTRNMISSIGRKFYIKRKTKDTLLPGHSLLFHHLFHLDDFFFFFRATPVACGSFRTRS